MKFLKTKLLIVVTWFLSSTCVFGQTINLNCVNKTGSHTYSIFKKNGVLGFTMNNFVTVMNGDTNQDNGKWTLEETENEFKFISIGKLTSMSTTINRLNGKETSLIIHNNKSTLIEYQCESIKEKKF